MLKIMPKVISDPSIYSVFENHVLEDFKNGQYLTFWPLLNPNSTCVVRPPPPLAVVWPRSQRTVGAPKPPSPRGSPLSLNWFKGPTKQPKPSSRPLERARAPDQQPTEPFEGMGPLELDGDLDEEPIALRAAGGPESGANGPL